jgi:hypothetical protein
VNRWLPVFREHKIGIVAALAHLDLRGVSPEFAARLSPEDIRAERRLGELIEAQKETVGLNRGTAGAGRPRLGGVKVTPPKDDRPTLAAAGIDKDR